MNTTIWNYFNHLTCTLFVVLGLLGIFAPASQAARDTTAPTVSITSPTSGTTVTSAKTVRISASASDKVGISKVDIYDGTTLLKNDTTSPYYFDWVITSANNGSHNLTAKAYDAAGNIKVSTAVAVTINIPVQDLTAPTVSITSPTSGTTVTSAQTLRISASALDNVGISKVDIYDGTTLLKNDTTSPYYFDWVITNANNGIHNLTAKAYDAAGNIKVSTAVAVTINIPAQDLTAPTVTLTSPTSGTTLTSAQTVTIAASASDNVGVSKVELYNGSTLMGTDTSAPYSFAWAISSANNGSYSLSAKAYDAAGNSKISAAAAVTVNIPVQDLSAPTVSLTSPAAGTTFTSAQTVRIAASATSSTGVSKVDLYDGATLLKNDTTSPYYFDWVITSAHNGSHNLTAKAYDAAGNIKVSTVAVTVNIPVQDLSAPTVTLTSPTAGTTITSAQTVRIAASATSTTGISKVDLYDGATLLKNDTTSPYYFDWAITSAHNGSHNLTAKLYDAAGKVTSSTTVAININIATETPIYDSSTRTPLSLRIDPTFTVDSLPADTRLWYNRFLAGMRNPNQYPSATTSAQTNDTYQYGRTVNTNITTVLQMLRVTGDRQLLDEVDRLSQLMRAQLKDWSILTYGGSTYQADGYLNWQWHYTTADGYVGTDAHEMDEMLAHSLVASYAYAFYVNRDLDPRYAERAQFWTNYLKNHFEAKWRKRNNKATGFPFLEKLLAHPYMQFVRYHYYMAKLTGDKAYETEALRMAGNINKQIIEVSTPIGTGSVWAHGMTLLGANSPGIQSTSYARYTVQGAADLAAEGFSVFGQAGYMDRIAVTLANNIMDGNLSAYAAYINGSGSGGESLDVYAISPWAMLGRWDKTGEVRVETDRVYRKLESSPENPKRIYLPAGMVYLLTR